MTIRNYIAHAACVLFLLGNTAFQGSYGVSATLIMRTYKAVNTLLFHLPMIKPDSGN